MTQSLAIRSVTRSSLLFALLAAGCGQPTEQVASAATAAPPAPPAKVDPVVKGVPHGAHILEVAVTEQGDAALTFDNVGDIRLWPALDGSRTPVPITAVAPHELALGHAGRDLLAAVLDDAGSVRLMRLGRDGSVRGQVQLPADVAYKQVVAVDDGVLVRSDDQTIEWFAGDGTSRGRLVAEPSRRIQAIAARNGQAFALVTTGSEIAGSDGGVKTAAELDWLLMMGGKLTWGASTSLPTTAKNGLVALSPSHQRVAIVDDKSQMTVYELGLVPVKLGESMFTSDAGNLGFVDDDHVAVMGFSSVQWWVKPHKPASGSDPWAGVQSPPPTPQTMQITSGGAIADNVAVTPFGAALALTDTAKVHYLGYKEHGVGNLAVGPTSLAMAMTGSHVVWLDNKLAIEREVELRPESTSTWIYATPIGDHHLVTQTPFEGKYKVELVDADNKERRADLGMYTSVERVDFALDSGLLGVSTYGKIDRFQLDLANNTATKLPAIKVRGSLSSLHVFDPAKTGGITAITIGWDRDYDEYYTLTVYRTEGKPKQVHRFTSRIVDIHDNGIIYTQDGSTIQMQRGDEKLGKLTIEHAGAGGAVNSDGSRFAVQADNEVVVTDAAGAVQWKRPLWGAAQLVFSKDDKHLAVRANGGLVLLSAATGEREAMECGWSFGLMTTPPNTNALASPPVCEDPM
jgi:hypothetical protein